MSTAFLPPRVGTQLTRYDTKVRKEVETISHPSFRRFELFKSGTAESRSHTSPTDLPTVNTIMDSRGPRLGQKGQVRSLHPVISVKGYNETDLGVA